MIFAEPTLSREDHKVLEILEGQRRRLRIETQHNPRRWHGVMRRSMFARAIQGSNAIEGYNATMDEAMAAVEDEPALDERTETSRAIGGYRAAMTCIMQAAEDPHFEWSKQFLKGLHFMMTGFDLNAHPGTWRPGAVQVVDHATGVVVYDAPYSDLVDYLVSELVEYLDGQNYESVVVAAAMAHLNLTLIHPFKDGNGRMARALQTLVLAREGLVHPLFSSIEEWLGRNTQDYYDVLADVGQGAWNPANDALPWVRFCLKAHYQQANTVIRRHEEYEALFSSIETLVERHRLNERMAVPLFNAAVGMRITNARYQKETDESTHVAGRDLKALADLALLVPHGEKRGRYYTAGTALREAREAARRSRAVRDPYELPEVSADPGPRLPGL
ncbi:MAG: Fic family protein [Rhodospirillales bacterium]|nr:Fic family protein [Rhodospirillales bacterium]MDE0378121.1 Fic family protein [Rhodospirillales bacterium]